MGKKLYPSYVLKHAMSLREALKLIDEGLEFGRLNIAALSADIEELEQTRENLSLLETQLIDLRNRRDDLYLSTWDKVKRLRAGIKGAYGDDSSEYEMVGGTRRSERKKARRSP
jgi:hypothetical protein